MKMNEYQFTLKFAIKAPATEIDAIIERLGAEGCTDALVGIGQPGLIGLDFTREASSAIDAVTSAIADVKRGMPEAQLVEAAPDLVGLTDIADLLGYSRQNVRKIFVKALAEFPPPVHEGSPSMWHLLPVLRWFKQKGTGPISQAMLDIAFVNRQVNLVKEMQAMEPMEPAVQSHMRKLFA
jgi:hypothetical protein